MRTPIEALKEIRDRLTYFCLRIDGRYDPPWATELVGIIDESVTACHGIVNSARTSEKSSAVGNAAAMREALVAFVRAYEMDNELDNIEDELDNIEATSEAYEKARASLSIPLRQCDVGTAEEQAQRYDQFCEENECSMCPVHAKWRQHFDVCKHEHISCGLIWAQMPYEAGEKGVCDER